MEFCLILWRLFFFWASGYSHSEGESSSDLKKMMDSTELEIAAFLASEEVFLLCCWKYWEIMWAKALVYYSWVAEPFLRGIVDWDTELYVHWIEAFVERMGWIYNVVEGMWDGLVGYY
jgi:hypothetical protein